MPPLVIDHDVALAPLTTFELGGKAQHFARIDDDAMLLEALRWAQSQALPVTMLGGGSNVVVSDHGVPGLVLQLATRGVHFEAQADGVVQVRAAAGEPWDALVARCVDAGLAGLECLSGIPGLVGATPIQNVGAYGQEVADTITAVEVLERATLTRHTLPASACAFAYRHSAFKTQPERYVVLAVTFALHERGAPQIRYAELKQALAANTVTPRSGPSLAQVRDTVIALRRGKSMVLDPNDDNRRSAGSFFTNPIVSAAQAQAVIAAALEQKLVTRADEVPCYVQADGQVKLAAAWLLERAGVQKGMRYGHFGVSSRHALALVHHGGGHADELLAVAQQLTIRVRTAFGVDLQIEPVLLGFDKSRRVERDASHS